MRSSLLKETLISLYKVQRTVSIEGPPGGGKTSIVNDAAAEMVSPLDGMAGVPVIVKHMPTMLVEDFGILFPKGDSDELEYKIPDWFPAEGKPGTERGGVLLFDDRNQASSDLQKVLANICQARELHGHKLAENWMVVSTGNRQEDKAGANRILSHLRNRETVLEYETNLGDWVTWASQNSVQPEVISFVNFRPGLLHDFKADRDQNATPRSWVEGVSDIIGIVPKEAEFDCFTGAVGKGPAAEFVGFLRIYRSLPNPDLVIMNPKTADVPTDPATLYALSGALAARASNGNLAAICTYLDRVPPEFSVLTINMCIRRDKTLANTQAMADWCIRHKDVLW